MNFGVDAFFARVPDKDSLSDLRLIEIFIYFLTVDRGHSEAKTAEIRQCFVDCDLTLPTRLSQHLSEKSKKSTRIPPKFIKTDSGYRIVRNLKEDIDGLLSKPLEIVPSDSVVPLGDFENTRKYLVEIVHQINGCYDVGYYASCAVMMRRLAEMLLLEVCIANGFENEVKDVAGNFVGLEAVISVSFSKRELHWNRNSRKDLEAIKKIGDTAAHDRFYVTRKPDVDDLKIGYRRLIGEMVTLSRLHI